MKKAGLPTSYKYDAKILRRADRDKLDGKACPDCKAVRHVSCSNIYIDTVF